MASRERVRPQEKKPLIIAEWRTGEYTVRQLADRHGVSPSFAGACVKGVPKDTKEIVDKLIESKCQLAQLDGQSMDAVHEIVDRKTSHLIFFANAAVQNVKEAMASPCESQGEFRLRAATIKDCKEAAVGKEPSTAIQINTAQNAVSLSRDDLAAIISGRA